MPAEKGSAFLLKVGDGGLPPVYATIAGLRTTQLSLNAPVVHVAGELIKYGVCEQIGPVDFRIGKLVRGCFGSESKIALHPANTTLCLLSAQTMSQFNALGLRVDDSALFEAFGIGDTSPVRASISNVGLAIRPLPPCHVKAMFDPQQNLLLSWIRRSRLDPGWRDYTDLPFDEPQFDFELSVESGGIPLATYEVQVENLEIGSATISSWGLPAGSLLTVNVRQRGANAMSSPASKSIVLN